MRQQELRNNPASSFGDGANRAGFGSFVDLIGGMGWKGTAVVILLVVIGYVLYKLLS